MDPLVTGSLISGGIKLLGGMFGRSSAKKAARRRRQQALLDQKQKFVRLRDAAERGGFNPLTALQSTGGGGFGALPSGVPPLASTNVITGLSESVGQYFADRQRVEENERQREHEIDMIRERAEYAGGAAPVLRRTAGVAQKKEEVATQKDSLEYPDRMATNAYAVHKSGWVDPRYPDAEHAEQRSGDVAQEIAGAANTVRDVLYTRKLSRVEDQYGRDVALSVDEALRADPRSDLDEIIEEKTEGAPRKIRPKLGPKKRGPSPAPFGVSPGAVPDAPKPTDPMYHYKRGGV